MFQEPCIRRIMAVLGIMATIALAAYTYYTIKQSQYIYTGPTTISVTGEGEVTAIPDVVTFNFTVSAKEADASTAQTKANETMGKILTFLKEKGVDEKDIKAESYDLSPQYEYPDTICNQWGYCPPQKEPKIIGYQLNQTMSVKVRKMEDAGTLIGGIGEFGAQNVSSLTFTIDDKKKLKAEAREKAIADAREKADVLAKNLGVTLVRMNGYWEDEGYGYGYPQDVVGYGGYGYGGDASLKEAAVAVEVPPGEQKVTASVNITYEVK